MPEIGPTLKYLPIITSSLSFLEFRSKVENLVIYYENRVDPIKRVYSSKQCIKYSRSKRIVKFNCLIISNVRIFIATIFAIVDFASVCVQFFLSRTNDRKTSELRASFVSTRLECRFKFGIKRGIWVEFRHRNGTVCMSALFFIMFFFFFRRKKLWKWVVIFFGIFYFYTLCYWNTLIVLGNWVPERVEILIFWKNLKFIQITENDG